MEKLSIQGILSQQRIRHLDLSEFAT